MIARVATFEGINIENARSTMDEAEAVIRPLMEGLAGYQGRLDLANLDGQFVSITFFASEEDATAAEPTFDEELPRQFGEIFASWEGTRTSVALHTVVIDERV
jgi:hypothetical protein